MDTKPMDLVENTSDEKALIKLRDLQTKRATYLKIAKVLEKEKLTEEKAQKAQIKKQKQEQALAKKLAKKREKLLDIEQEFIYVFTGLCIRYLEISINELKQFNAKELQVIDNRLAEQIKIKFLAKLQSLLPFIRQYFLSWQYLKYRKLLKDFFGKDYFPAEATQNSLSNYSTDNGPLYFAARTGRLEELKSLLENGADINANNGYAFCLAAIYGQMEAVKLLLEKGANIHAGLNRALSGAAYGGNLEITNLLIERGADVNAQNGEPLCTAVRHRHLEIAKLLIEKGADPHASKFILDWAKHNKDKDMIRLLEQYMKTPHQSQHVDIEKDVKSDSKAPT